MVFFKNIFGQIIIHQQRATAPARKKHGNDFSVLLMPNQRISFFVINAKKNSEKFA